MTSERVSAVLSAFLLVLLAALTAEAWYVWGASPPPQTAARPVVTGDIAAKSAVQSAAADAATIFTNSWRNYDGHVDRATSVMTPEFAVRYRRGAAPVRAGVVSARITTTTLVSGAGVVRASPQRVLALLFLDQYTSAHGQTSYAARRALVTMQHTADGWLVGNVQTQ